MDSKLNKTALQSTCRFSHDLVALNLPLKMLETKEGMLKEDLLLLFPPKHWVREITGVLSPFCHFRSCFSLICASSFIHCNLYLIYFIYIFNLFTLCIVIYSLYIYTLPLFLQPYLCIVIFYLVIFNGQPGFMYKLSL